MPRKPAACLWRNHKTKAPPASRLCPCSHLISTGTAGASTFTAQAVLPSRLYFISKSLPSVCCREAGRYQKHLSNSCVASHARRERGLFKCLIRSQSSLLPRLNYKQSQKTLWGSRTHPPLENTIALFRKPDSLRVGQTNRGRQWVWWHMAVTVACGK